MRNYNKAAIETAGPPKIRFKPMAESSGRKTISARRHTRTSRFDSECLRYQRRQGSP